MLRKALLLGLALFLWSAAEAATQRYVALSNNEVVGTLDVVQDASRVSIDYRIDDNGRGAKLRESMVLDSQGLPSEWRIEGAGTIGAPVKESYHLAGRKASWRSLNDSGEARTEAARVYVATDSSPWAYGVYLRALLRRPDLALNALPAGTLKAEKLRDITLGKGEGSRQVAAYALWGIRTEPLFVLADDAGGFFGTIASGFVVVPQGYEAEYPQLSQLAGSLSREYLERLTRQLVHRFDAPLYIQNARVFDSHTGALRQPGTVVVYRGRIVGVRGNTSAPAEAVVVDAQGGTLLPGLTDMHSHVSDWDMPLYLAGGVTTVRDLGNHNDVLLDLISRTRAGVLPGPEIIPSGFIEGRSPYSAKMGFVVDQLPAALEKVRWYADHGYPAIKLYSSITPDWVAPIAAEAHRLGLRVSGHVPAFMTSERAVRDGYDEINHMNQLLLSFVLSPQEDTRTPLRFTAVGERMGKLDLQSEPVQRMVRLMKERGTTLDVTMAGLEWMLLSQPGKSPPSIEAWLSHMPGPVQRARRTAVLDMKPGQLPLYQASWKKLLEALKLLYDAGIPIVPGTDDVPGFMLHSELEVYGRAGIPPSRVLQLATLGCARYLHRDHEVGSIEQGKVADLLLVDGDPTVDLSAIRRIRMVIRKGDVLFPEEVYSTVGIQPFAKRPPLQSSESAQSRYEAQLSRLALVEPLRGPPAEDVAILNVNVLPMTSDRLLRNQVVLVGHGRIVSLGPAGEVQVPAGTRTIDGAGGYLLPGLADMHVHSAGNPLTLALFLANGVTTVREMSGRPSYLEWSRRVAAGELLGPSIYTTGPIVGGRRDEVETVKVSGAGEAARVVTGQYEAGYRILKPYTFLSAEEYRSAVGVAKAKGMYIVGHVPYSVGTLGVLAAGQNEIAHVHSFHQDYFEHFDPQHVFGQYSVDPTFIPKTVPRIKRSGVAVTTTLVVDQALADSQDIDGYAARAIQVYEPSAGTAWMRSGEWEFNKLWPHEYLESVYLPYLYKLTQALHSAGVPLVLGTDSGVPGLIHGFSTHEELGLLVRAGLTPFEALKAATTAAAAVSSDQDWGTVEVGKRADLLLLEANPLEDIGRTRRIVGVMKAGRWLNRATLDHLLAQVREAYQ